MDIQKAKNILELGGDTFTPEQVKQNYHRLSLKFHPDKGGNPDDFVLLNQAYDFLTKENNQSSPEIRTHNVINLNDIFRTFITPNLNKIKSFVTKESSSFFGFKKEITIKITPKEFLEGVTKEIEQPYKMHCGCEPKFCDRCRGFSLQTCRMCNGTGILFCGNCINGFTTHTRKIKINLPKNSLKSIVFENVIIHVELKKEKNYLVKDTKLYYRYPISLKESLIGFEKTFIDPFEIEHTITSNSIIKQNDGYFILDHLFLLFDIVYPTKLKRSVIEKLKLIDF